MIKLLIGFVSGGAFVWLVHIPAMANYAGLKADIVRLKTYLESRVGVVEADSKADVKIVYEWVKAKV